MKSAAAKAWSLLLGSTVRGRIGRVILLAALVPLLGMALYVVTSLTHALGTSANDNLENHARLQAAAVANVLGQAATNVELLASNPILRSPTASEEEQLQQLEQAERFFHVFEDITLVDPMGRVIASTSYVYYGSWSANAVFRQALAGEPSMSEARIVPSPDRLVVEFAAPVVGAEGQAAGVVVGRMNMERVWEVLDPIKIGETGFLVAFDKHGNLLAYPDKALLLSRLDGYPESPGLNGATSLHLTGTEGEELVGRIAPVGLLDWQVAALQERSETYGVVNDAVQKLLISVVVVLVVTGSISFVLSRAITRPIRAVAAAMQKIATGSLDERVPSAGLGEIDVLSASFNTMAENLEERTAELTEEVGQRKRAEDQMRYHAYHDALTGLPNRALFQDRLAIALAQARRSRQMVGIMFLDLDRFKLVNDTLGHVIGDQLLQAIAKRLAGLVREGDTVARMGGDEFAVLVPTASGAVDTSEVASRILKAFRQPWVVVDEEFHLTTSIGIAMYPSDGEDAETLLRNADTAMYRAKDEGRDGFQVFTTAMNEYIVKRVGLENELRRGLEREEFVLHYQPQVNVHTGQIVGVEALVRWQHPERGLVYPGEFIPLAEDSGLIVPLGEWVMRTACAQNKAWQEAGLPPMRVAVNLSARQFQHPQLPDLVAKVLEETALAPQWLDLEITESSVIRDMDFAAATLSEMREMGVHVSIDDFGTGYSSLAHLRRLPVDALKIDCSFVLDLTTDPDDAAIVTAVIGLAKSLNLRAIAEGVETEDQLAFLKKEDCHEAQGYFFDRPMPAEAVEKALARREPSPA